MVRLPNHGEIWCGSQKDGKAALAKAVEVKLEVEDHLEEEHGPLSKRNKVAATLEQKFGAGAGMVSPEALHYNLLNEPSPLGLRLRKSPSFLDLIQMRLSQAHSAATTRLAGTGNLEAGTRKDLRPTSGSATGDKLKASNFPASLLRIGTWECISRYEGDLVAKCYYAKHKLVWEVLESGLKSKIEIQWSDITALKANCPENGLSTLDIVLSRQPLFFRETNPQPRKHTLWQATSDFTGRQASIHRRHFLQCPEGLLSKHFEKLIQCDPRLNSLSRQPEIILESPHFELRCSIFEGHQDDSSGHSFNNLNNDLKPSFSGFPEAASPSDAPTASCNSKSRVPAARTLDHVAREIPSPSSVSDSQLSEENAISGMEQIQNLRSWNQLKLAGLKPSMSIKDLAHHLEHCISEQMNSGNPVSLPSRDVWEELTQYLLSDTQVSSVSDELSLMSRVDSLCCLLQKDGTAVNNFQWNNAFESQDSGKPHPVPGSTSEGKSIFDIPNSEVDQDDTSECKQQGFSRKESFGELLLHIPRIASLPQFLFNISEDSENQAR